MADLSNRDVQRGVNRNTNQQVQSIRKLVQGVPPNVQGTRNPDGTYDNGVSTGPLGTQPPPPKDDKSKQKPVGVFQLLADGIKDIISKLNQLLQKQHPILDKQSQQQFINELIGKISPNLLGNIKIEFNVF